MLRLRDDDVTPVTQSHLASRQADVDGCPDYAGRIAKAKALWDAKRNTVAGKAAFDDVRAVLEGMCCGAVRCAYCNDSAGDEIEHVLPKSVFPDHAFRWSNYVLACGPCNGTHKRDKYAYLDAAGRAQDVTIPRKATAAVLPPPPGPHALIDPRMENPLDFLELDLVAHDPAVGWVEGEFRFEPRPRLDPGSHSRAVYTRNTLGLNRRLLLDARRDAFRSYRARIKEYAQAKAADETAHALTALRDGILQMPHPAVFVEMQRQHRLEPLKRLFDSVPEALAWAF